MKRVKTREKKKRERASVARQPPAATAFHI